MFNKGLHKNQVVEFLDELSSSYATENRRTEEVLFINESALLDDE